MARASSAPPLVALRGARLTLGERVLFENADVTVAKGERICLVGRNGSGKSTLLKCLAGMVDLDQGERFVQPGAKIAYLPQDPPLPKGVPIRDHVAGGLASAPGEHPAEYLVDAIMAHLGIDGERTTDGLSGGESRRVALARALVSEPDVLLLDEPTNHLDLPTIEWLEDELAGFKGGILLISHDRTILGKLSNRTYWIDRGEVRRNSDGFAAFPDWADKVLADEEATQRRLDKQIAEETRWLREGLTARRKRNMGRVRTLLGMRREKAERMKRPGLVNMSVGDAEQGGQLVIEANHISKAFALPDGGEKVIATDFSTIVRRGDRIGLVGANGAGKTTLLKMLIGEEKPDKGRVRVGFGVEAVYFDQYREALDGEATLWSTLCPGGGDTIFVHGKPKHVVSYLRDFLFEERQARAHVKNLSGGERNRLLLAKLFAAPHNLLVLDEPTNDLDIETLDLLQEVLAEYEGTIILVSHDRDFLDRVVTSVIAVEGDGRIEEFVGGFSDYAALRRQEEPEPASAPKKKDSKPAAATEKPAQAKTKLSYKDQRALEILPNTIEKLGTEIAALADRLADPDLFTRDPDAFQKASKRLETAQAELDEAETKWLELEEMRENLEKARAS
ncbi:ATP-binding cassette domain-containing protein [Nisaea acidiphila]|uniref:ATP-binding protein Uup n=1 Tax=Nisaea acidiphila TaxID=1862145 RepID=A0A9J7AV88_9PROT|nr:ATP-binding cassette domain-containing protein [Nisaea acidiphila]UUX51247.1 ATP-binding cassette domain-containing protein [Nisaea acidiphila]